MQYLLSLNKALILVLREDQSLWATSALNEGTSLWISSLTSSEAGTVDSLPSNEAGTMGSIQVLFGSDIEKGFQLLSIFSLTLHHLLIF